MLFVLSTVIMLFFSVVSLADDPNRIKAVELAVQVINGTADGNAVTGDSVTLFIYEHEEFAYALSAEVDQNGMAVFADIPADDHTIAFTDVLHAAVKYQSRPVLLKREKKMYIVDINVFDVSCDRSKLFVKTHHVIIRPYGGYLSITEHMILENSGDMAVISEKKDQYNRPVVLEIFLPEGFENLGVSRYFDEQTAIVTKDGFYDTMVVLPGQFEAAFSYTLKVSLPVLRIQRKLSLPVKSFIVSAELGNARLEGLGAPQQISGRDGNVLDYYLLENLDGTGTITFQITGFNTRRYRISSWVISSVVFCSLSGAAICRSARAKKKNRENCRNQVTCRND
ncbi:MAG: hypothetical protein ABIG61_09625 [Planctomycetota bacterium]